MLHRSHPDPVSARRPAARVPARRAACATLAGLLLLAAGPVRGQQDAPGGARKQVRAARVEGRAPVVDGRLNDPAWDLATPVADFAQREPDEGKPPVERTEVRVLYGSDALYVGARMYSDAPGAIRAPISRRDNGTQAEYLLVSLDTYLDRRTAYTFGVTASGVRLDWYHPEDSRTQKDNSFDPVWEARTQVDSLGWTAEMRIPFSQLRYSGIPVQTWGVNFNRWIPTRNEDDYWIVVPTKGTGWSSHFGELVGIEGIRSSRRVEVLPYVASGASYISDPGAGNPFHDGSEVTTRVGGDVKVGIGSNLTLEGTVNPDFGQVEADPAEVNLTAFETVFPEKRSFFIEGSRLLRGGGRTFFYSRRIGARPTRLVQADYLDYPSRTTILGAAKLTGRMPSGTSVGGLVAMTNEDDARVYDTATREFGRVRVAPRTGFGVMRLQQEFGEAASTVGLTMTGVARDLSVGDPLAPLMRRNAFAGGADWNLRFRDGEYEVNGHAGLSHIGGDSLAILRAQRSSARYFQRPDAGHVQEDVSRTSLTGYTLGLGVSRNSGRHWLWDASMEAASPGFEINDLGAMGAVDDVWANAGLRYRETTPGKWYRNYQIGTSVSNLWNFGGVRNYTYLSLDGTVTWKNFSRTTLTAYLEPPAQDDALSWGGPLVGTGTGWGGLLNVSNSAASRTRVRGQGYFGGSTIGYRTWGVSSGVTVQRGPRWQFSMDPSYSRETESRQFITSRAGGPEATWRRSYIFSFVELSTLSTRFRLNYTVTPDLSLELYAEPFAASGRFFDYGYLPAPRSRELTFFTEREVEALRLPEQDFNVLSFRSNAVMRWEWRPGSTVFLVWQQDRSAEEEIGHLVGMRSLLRSVQASGDNLFAIKVSYWLPLH